MCEPFLKWVGGKRQLLPEILSRLPADFNNYHEPFLGGGAVFFSLFGKGFFDSNRTAHLSDLNSELIVTYKVVRSELSELVGDLKRHRNTPRYFEQVRAEDRSARFHLKKPYKRASRFIFLNKTAFNGLYRVNQSGFFNTSYGYYKNPVICNEPVLHACSLALQKAQLVDQGFEDALSRIGRGDLVYLDPPYDPVSKTASFVGYTAGGFSGTMQQKVKEFCDEVTWRGAFLILSNSATKEIVELYNEPHYHIDIVSAKRHINCKGDKRGSVDEVLIRNFS